MSRINEQYTDEESAFARAFTHHATSCVATCACGREYFCSARGHGDYEPGELDTLKQKAAAPNSKTFECHEFDTIDLPATGGEELVVQCVCGKAHKYINWLESNIEAIVGYLRIRLDQRRRMNEHDLRTTTDMIATVESMAASGT